MKGVFYVVRLETLLENCVVTHIYNNSWAVCSWLRGPCRGNIRKRIPKLGAESNASTVALRVVGGGEKRSLESERVKYGSPVPRDWDPRMTALARASSNCKRQTRPLVRESAPHQQNRNCLTVIKIWSQAPDGCFIPRQTGRLTVGRNISQTKSKLEAVVVQRSRRSTRQLQKR
jgi:hypothetical protein